MKIKLVLYRKCNTGIHFNFPENNFVQAYQMYLDIFVNFLTTRICKKKFGRTMSGLKTEDTLTLAAVSLLDYYWNITKNFKTYRFGSRL